MASAALKDLPATLRRPPSPQARFAVMASILLGCLYIDVTGAGLILRTQPWGVDFLPMWAAARSVWSPPANPYDFAAITQAQAWLLGPASKLRPWVYPPSALVILAPLGLVGFSLSRVIWIAATVAVNLWGAVKARIQVSTLALAFVVPPSMLVAISGQVSFLISGLGLLSLSLMARRPVLAGALLGLAGAVKPSPFVLLPVALLAARAYRTLGAAIATSGALAACSLMLWGFQSWIDWLGALPRFQLLVMTDPSLVERMISPSSLAAMLGAQAWVVTSFNLGFGLLAAALVWRVFRISTDPVLRLTAMLGGGLLAAPYAMQYDAALLAIPAAVMVAKSRSVGSLIVACGGYLILSVSVVPGLGVVATAIFLVVACVQQIVTVRANGLAPSGRLVETQTS